MTEQTLFDMLSDALWKGVYHTDIRQEVLDEARRQTVDGLIQPISRQRIVKYVQYTYEESELTALLNGSGIPFVILKGSAAAVYYPTPSGRSFGDIDLIVPPERFSDAAQLLEENGFTRGADSERHLIFTKDGFHFELHHRFSHEDADLESYILDGIAHRETGRIDEHEFPMLPPLANGLVLLDHMRTHLKSGMGLRQIVDWMLYCDKVLDDAFWEGSFRAAAAELGLTTLAITVTALCQRHLGLKPSITWCRDPDDELVALLLDSLMTSGNFGRKRGKGKNVESILVAMKREGLFGYLQRAGEKNWDAYQRHPWLRPFCWLYQIFRYMRRGRGHFGRLGSDLKRGNERYELLKKLGID